jgi:hypothetical protein
LQELFWSLRERFDLFHGSQKRTQRMISATPAEKAYAGPFVVFIGLLFLSQLVVKPWEGQAFWMVSAPQYWVYPLQTVICGAMLLRWWRHYELRTPARVWWAVAVGVAVLALWVAPQAIASAFPDHALVRWLRNAPVFGVAFMPRLEGFRPDFFGSESAIYILNFALRFVRLVIIVPLVEEIFWRGFLLRYVIRPDFQQVPFGTFTWPSFWIVTAGFCLEHQTADWPAAIAAGALYNLVAYRTRSLSACVLAHAITNALLGWYVLRTGQWGFW